MELDTETLAYLYGHHFIPGDHATVVGRGPDGAYLLDASGTTLTLGVDLCSQLYVSRVAEASPDAPIKKVV